MFLMLGAIASHAVTVESVRKKMGSRFEVLAVAPDRAQAERAVEAAYAEIDRIEALISSWREDSQTSAINRRAGQGPVIVSSELFALLRRALKVSKLTGGAFDVTFASAGRYWNFHSPHPRLPDAEEIRRALSSVGFDKVKLDEDALTVELLDAGTRIGFGAIGKGYAANRAVAVMKAAGIEAGVVSAGGDLMSFGRKENGAPWSIGIADPLHRDAAFAHLDLTDTAVVTSGDYESFVEIDGQRYAHILDPRTGYPVAHLRSVTVICPDAELADALATGVFVLGPTKGLELIDRLHGIEALLIAANGEILTSKNLKTLNLPAVSAGDTTVETPR